MTIYYLINPENEIINSVLADTPELALLGTPPETVAVIELGPEHHYPMPPPAAIGPPEPITKLSFLRRFTADERIAIRTSADPVIVDFMALLDLASEVRLDDPDTLAALGYLTCIGILAPERADTILS